MSGGQGALFADPDPDETVARQAIGDHLAELVAAAQAKVGAAAAELATVQRWQHGWHERGEIERDDPGQHRYDFAAILVANAATQAYMAAMRGGLRAGGIVSAGPARAAQARERAVRGWLARQGYRIGPAVGDE